MKRIEYKIREVNREWLEGILFKHGAEKTFEGELTDIYYDKPSERFLKKGKRLVLRSKGETHKLSFRDKYDTIGMGIIDEWEVEVDDAKMMDQILIGLGFTHFKLFRKNRVDYHKDDVFISFDKYIGDLSYIPEFMMIEGSGDKEVFEWAELFGYKEDDCEALSVLDLINYYKKKHDADMLK